PLRGDADGRAPHRRGRHARARRRRIAGPQAARARGDRSRAPVDPDDRVHAVPGGETVRPVRTAVIPAAGLGTRFLPFSRSVPKELLPIVDTPVLDLVVSECVASGIERVILVIGPGKESLAAYFRP